MRYTALDYTSFDKHLLRSNDNHFNGYVYQFIFPNGYLYL